LAASNMIGTHCTASTGLGRDGGALDCLSHLWRKLHRFHRVFKRGTVVLYAASNMITAHCTASTGLDMVGGTLDCLSPLPQGWAGTVVL